MLIMIVFASIKPFVSHTAPSAADLSPSQAARPRVLGAPRLSGSPWLVPHGPSRSTLISSPPNTALIHQILSLSLFPLLPSSHSPCLALWWPLPRTRGWAWCDPQSPRGQAGPGGQEGAELSPEPQTLRGSTIPTPLVWGGAGDRAWKNRAWRFPGGAEVEEGNLLLSGD